MKRQDQIQLIKDSKLDSLTIRELRHDCDSIRLTLEHRGHTDKLPLHREVKAMIKMCDKILKEYVKFKEANIFESNSHLNELPPVHDTGKTKILRNGRIIQKT